jgi:hypothetical protein
MEQVEHLRKLSDIVHADVHTSTYYEDLGLTGSIRTACYLKEPAIS